MNLVQYYKGQYIICLTKEVLDRHSRSMVKRKIRIDSKCIKWTPKDWSKRGKWWSCLHRRNNNNWQTLHYSIIIVIHLSLLDFYQCACMCGCCIIPSMSKSRFKKKRKSDTSGSGCCRLKTVWLLVTVLRALQLHSTSYSLEGLFQAFFLIIMHKLDNGS